MKIKAFCLLFLAVGFAGAQDATPKIVQDIFDARCTYCHFVAKPDPEFPDDPPQGGEGWSGTYNNSDDIDNALALSLYDHAFQPIEGEAALMSYARLVNAPTFQEPETAPTLRVDPGNLDNSYLYQKVASDTPKDHDPMPPPAGGLDSTELCIIRTWIESGANPAASDGGTDYASACGVNSIRMRHIKYNGKDALPKTNWPYVIHESDNFYDLRGRHLQIEIEKK